ncbi:50S ribosomal protein L13 [Candidatus Saccharibacteria bacterium RIFCSPHIGHO2_12_FULL_42_8]|nr:MAG: 50S ribosomal protein L13 [Candidatus Saccharibacteria bacterium RIFCSPHIGHO2_12_FULL_42_8]
MTSKTYSQKPSEVTRKWILIDASEAPLGRIAVLISKHLIGKYKPNYTPHIDGGDFVVVINAEKAVLTGDKEEAKTYYRHSGYPGGIKSATAKEVREKHPERLIEASVRGMLPKNKLANERMKRMKVFPGSEHDHTAQKPMKVEVK